MRGSFLAALLTIILAVPAILPAQTVRVTEDSPLEVKLAFIDTDQVRMPRSLVRRYARLLNGIDARCTETRQQVSDRAVRASQLLERDTGREIQVLALLRAWDEAVAEIPNPPSQECSSMLATIMVMIRGG